MTDDGGASTLMFRKQTLTLKKKDFSTYSQEQEIIIKLIWVTLDIVKWLSISRLHGKIILAVQKMRNCVRLNAVLH